MNQIAYHYRENKIYFTLENGGLIVNKKQSFKVLFVSAEVAPFAKSGGLADVAGSLPKTLVAKGHDVRIAMPRYKEIKQDMTYVTDFSVKMQDTIQTCIVRKAQIQDQAMQQENGVTVYMIDNHHYFDRDGMYCHFDDAERYAFFCKAVLAMLPKVNFKPDVIHCNDWQAGPITFLLKDKYKDEDFYQQIATVFTIHNLQYQGTYGRETIKALDIDESYFTPEQFEFYGQFNFIKTGILYGDIINTVSETYAKEIQTPEYGERLQDVLRIRSSDLYGIVNGIDARDFNPAYDTFIYKNYDARSMENKKLNKSALQKSVHLPVKDVPVLGLIHRLVSQKGLDLIKQIEEQILRHDLQFIVLGVGDPYYEEMFKKMQQKYPTKVATFIEFNEALAHNIYAGADMFLMPSVFEPCGLGQLISLKYGTIPIVRHTGGLIDTIQDFNISTHTGNGFAFSEYASEGLLDAIERAIDVYTKHPQVWTSLVAASLSADYSWEKQANKYVQIYGKAVENVLN